MKILYDPDSDSIYIELSKTPSAESEEVADGVVLDYDASGGVTGIDIEHAKDRLDLDELVLSRPPFRSQRVVS